MASSPYFVQVPYFFNVIPNFHVQCFTYEPSAGGSEPAHAAHSVTQEYGSLASHLAFGYFHLTFTN